jgi:hypothetical protein
MSVYKIKFFSSFCCSNRCKEIFENNCETAQRKDYGKNKRIYICDASDNTFTHVILLNTAMPDSIHHIPKERVIGLAFEPPEFLGITTAFIAFVQKHVSKYFLGHSFGGVLPSPPFIVDYAFLQYTLPIYSAVPVKKKFMSIIISEKIVAPGHIYRHLLAAAILKTALPIDIYGRGCAFFLHPQHPSHTDRRIRGKFDSDSDEPYKEYLYTVAIENFTSDAYISEKCINPLLCGTNVLYQGASKVLEIFGPTSTSGIHLLTGNLVRDMNYIRSLYFAYGTNSFLCPIPQIDITNVKAKINFFNHLHKLFS